MHNVPHSQLTGIPSLFANIRDSVFFKIGVLAVLISFAVAFALIYVSGEQPVYTWDFGFFWENYWNSGEKFRTNPWSWFLNLPLETHWSDYNSIYTLFLLPFNFAFGRSREGYIAAVVVCYLLPAVIASAYLASTITARLQSSATGAWELFYATFALLYAPFWIPTLRGYPDIVGVTPLALAALIVVSADLSKKFDIRIVVVLGTLLWLPFLFRKWYAYSILAFYISAPIYSVAQEFQKRRPTIWQNIQRVVATYFSAGMISLVLVFVFQARLAVRWIIRNQVDSQFPYQIPFPEHLQSFWDYYGPFLLSLALIGLIFTLFTSIALVSLFIVCNLVLVFLFFSHVQYFGPHHYLPLSLWLYLLCCLGAAQLIGLSRQKVINRTVASAIIVLAGGVFYGTFFPLSAIHVGDSIFPNTKFYRLHLDTYPEYLRLVRDLTEVIGEGDRYSVFASNTVMSDSLIHYLSNATNAELDRHLTESSQVDNRYRFDLRPLFSRYVIVADPVQVHLPQGTQQVITVPATLILKREGIGKAYSQLAHVYHLEGGVRAYIFEKSRAFSPEEISELFEEFFRSYPEWRKYYIPSLVFSFLSARVSRGGSGADRDLLPVMEVVSPLELAIYPTGAGATTVGLPLGNKTKQDWALRSLTISFGKQGVMGAISRAIVPQCAEPKEVDVVIRMGAKTWWQGRLQQGGEVDLEMPSEFEGELELVVSSDSRSPCRRVHVAFRR